MIALTERQLAGAWAYAVLAHATRLEWQAAANVRRGIAYKAFAWVPVRQGGPTRETPEECLAKAEQLGRGARRISARAAELRGFVDAWRVKPSRRLAAIILGTNVVPAWEAPARPAAAE